MTEQDIDTMFRPATSNCMHIPRTCKTCLEGWVRSNVQRGLSNYITCPDGGCGLDFEYQDVQRALDSEAAADDWHKYENLRIRSYLSTLPNFVWCLSSGCQSGQVHDPENGPIMTCVSCGFKTCAEHQVPWHEGATCDAYDRRFTRVRNEERIYRVAIKFLGMKDCPGCGVTIQKRGGCDHMRCSACREEFCYRCRRNYDGPTGIWSRGKSAHSLICRHYWARMPWRWF